MNSKNLLRAIPVGVAVLRNDLVDFANQAFCQLVGVQEGELEGRSLYTSLSEEHQQVLTTIALPTLSIKGRWRGLLYDTSPKGLDGDIMLDLTEVGTNTIATAWPVLQPEKTASGIRRANAELVQANRVKDTFLANMSHDLRSPLATIMGVTEALLDGIYGDLNPEQARSMNDVSETSAHLLALINDLLDLSLVRFGAFDIHHEVVELRSLLRTITEIPPSEVRKRSITVDLQLPDEEIKIVADPRRLRQVLLNLIQNAAKFSPANSAISISLFADNDLNNVSISVCDQGIGIPAEKLSTIFEPFVQLDPLAKSQNSGSGLGLAIAQRIVDLHGGIISVNSVLGNGTTFTIILPTGREQVSKVLQVASSRSITPRRESGLQDGGAVDSQKVLFVVDDNKMQCDLLSEFAHRAGYRAITFASGEECLRGLEETWPDVAIVDIHMPKMNGLEVIEHIRKCEAIRSAPIYIIALTALSMPGDRELCLAAGADVFVSKPVVFRDLMQLLSQAAP